MTNSTSELDPGRTLALFWPLMRPLSPSETLRWRRVIFSAAFALRASVVAVALRDPSIPLRSDDYLGFGRQLVESGRYASTNFPPLYPALCAAAIRFLGDGALVSVLILQAVAGTLAIVLIERLARRFDHPGNGSLLVATLAALDPLLVIGTGFVLTEDLYTLLAISFVVVLVELDLGASGRRFTLGCLAAGALLGLGMLTRSIGVVLLPVSAGILLSTYSASFRQRLRAGVLVATATALLVVPWCVRNQRNYGRFALSSSGAYNVAALIVGPARSRSLGQEASADLQVWSEELATLDPGTRSNPYALAERARDVAVDWARAHPISLAKALVRSQLQLWFGPGRNYWGSLFGVPIESLSGAFVATLVAGRVALALVAFGGSWALFRSGGERRRLALIAAGIVLLHALPVGSAGYSRFLRPIVPWLALLAGLGLAPLACRAGFFPLHSPAGSAETPEGGRT